VFVLFIQNEVKPPRHILSSYPESSCRALPVTNNSTSRMVRTLWVFGMKSFEPSESLCPSQEVPGTHQCRMEFSLVLFCCRTLQAQRLSDSATQPTGRMDWVAVAMVGNSPLLQGPVQTPLRQTDLNRQERNRRGGIQECHDWRRTTGSGATGI
jgi:hypothetical protein